MNPADDPRPIDDETLDLLVDGELSEPARRELLGRLDSAPGGWRRCALAFLSAQCWRESLSELRRETQSGAARGTVPFSLGRKLGQPPYQGTLLAMASSFLAALTLGLVLRGAFGPGAPSGVQPEQIAVNGNQHIPAAPPAPAEQPWQYVSIPVSKSDGSTELVHLPATPRDSVDEHWLKNLPAAVPDELLRALRASGHEVRQQRRALPMKTPDGRSLVVPYDDVEIRYVGGRHYQ